MKRTLSLLVAVLRAHGSTLLELVAVGLIAGSIAALLGFPFGTLAVGVYLLIAAVLNGRTVQQ